MKITITIEEYCPQITKELWDRHRDQQREAERFDRVQPMITKEMWDEAKKMSDQLKEARTSIIYGKKEEFPSLKFLDTGRDEQ